MTYAAFIDPAGGSGQDSFTLAIAHRAADGTGILDLVAGIAPPFSPEGACVEFAATLQRYGVNKVTGDNYAAEWPKEMLRKHGIAYERSDKPKGTIYAEFLPLLNSRRVRLLDDAVMRRELCGLERRTAWGGKDTIDHPANGHDDRINAAGGVLVKVSKRAVYGMLSDAVLGSDEEKARDERAMRIHAGLASIGVGSDASAGAPALEPG